MSMHQSPPLQARQSEKKNKKNWTSQTSFNCVPTFLKQPPDHCESDRKSPTCRVRSAQWASPTVCLETAASGLAVKKAQWLLHLRSGQRRGSSLLAHNVNLALIKASVGTSVDNRKSLFIEKHPVVGLRVDDPSCCGPAERHMVVVVEPHTSSPPSAEQSYIPLT